MTREIALHCMKSASDLTRELCEECPIYGQTGIDHCYEDALQYVIGMLEQEPCEDAVSRQSVINKKGLVELEDGQSFYCISPEDVETLPSVTPIRPKGHWIEHEKSISTGFKHLRECSCCKCYFNWLMPRNSFCPNCGAKMVDPQESEEE